MPEASGLLVSSTTFKLHLMDNTNSGYKIVLETDDHRMMIRNRWENCGTIQEIISCSCGFVSCQHLGGGCWQDGHDKPKNHKVMDKIHGYLYNIPV